VGTVLDADCFHPGRTGRNHLAWVAAAVGLPDSRVDKVLEETDIAHVADRRTKGYSLGMRQRLALATALLGDPDILILDEPANGLDPQGMHWLRDLLLTKVRAGKTVLLSSHVLAELALVVDDIVVIEKGRLVKQGSLSELTKTQGTIHVRAPEAPKLATALRGMGGTVEQTSSNELTVQHLSVAEVGEMALKEGVAIHGMSENTESLEDVFLRLTTSHKE
jgi:ABC-2 type transport system ATP-binding protein